MVNAGVYFQAPDDQLYGLALFEQPMFSIGQPFMLGPEFNFDIRFLLVHTPVAQNCIHYLGHGAQAGFTATT